MLFSVRIEMWDEENKGKSMAKSQVDKISKEQAIQIAKEESQRRGWVWVDDVEVRSYLKEWVVKSPPDFKWIRARFRISKATGKVIRAEYSERDRRSENKRGCWLTTFISMVALFFLVVCYAMVRVVIYIVEISQPPPYADYTEPLDSLIVQDLCGKFELDQDDPRCDSVGAVYAPEFYYEVHNLLEAGELTSYPEWDVMFHDYQRCDPLQSRQDGSGFFWCDYDFKGDFVFRIHVTFNYDESLYRVHYVTPE